ncbi:MAG: hypothetical protein HYT80_11290 [Euryarchaeota archaeon]|nr:hypothetical protein [Euryarchaeota archaeon]
MVRFRWAWGTLVGFAVIALLLPSATAENARYMDAKFPQGRQGAAAAWDGRYAFIFGATGTAGLPILRYEPCRDAVVDTGSRLPGPRANPAALFDGTHVYVFGGWDAIARRLVDEVLRYDPALNELVMLKERLPLAAELMGAAWDGEHMFLFGGHVDSPTGMTDQVVRFTPATGEFRVMQAALPAPTTSSAGASDGEGVYVFGGGRQYPEGFQQTNAILRYDAARDEARDVGARLPGGRSKAAAVHAGREFFVFGGSGEGTQKQIVRYDSAADRAVLSPVSMPDITVLPSVAWDGARAYVFGVRDAIDGAENRIVEYDPSNPGQPANVPSVAPRSCPPAAPPPPPRTGPAPTRPSPSGHEAGTGIVSPVKTTDRRSTDGFAFTVVVLAAVVAVVLRRPR